MHFSTFTKTRTNLQTYVTINGLALPFTSEYTAYLRLYRGTQLPLFWREKNNYETHYGTHCGTHCETYYGPCHGVPRVLTIDLICSS